MNDRRICHPSLAGKFEMPLQTYPAVPDHKTVQTDQNKGKDYEEDNHNLGNFDQVMTKIIHDRCVEIVAKCHPTLSRNRQTFWFERE
jgi:hypothetical protein